MTFWIFALGMHVCVSTENSSVSKAARAGLVNLLEKDWMSSNYG